MRWYASLIAGLLLCGAAGSVRAQATRPTVNPEDFSFFVLTMSPGNAAYEKFGHNALQVRNRANATAAGNISFNWGMFDFNQEYFYLRFIQGRMLYTMSPFYTDEMLIEYIRDNRWIYSQELNLLPPQRVKLIHFLAWNDRPENRPYRYDYYRDNCSTRVRDAVDRATDGNLQRQLQAIRTSSTYRSLTRICTADDIPLYTALNFALGPACDLPLTAWEECFLPERLMEHLRTAQQASAGGMPLVKAESVISSSSRPPLPTSPPDRTAWFLAAGIVLGAILAGLAELGSRWRPARWGFCLVAVPWLLLIGIGGAFLVWCWLFSDHQAVWQNENVLQGSPLALLMVILAPKAIFGKARRSALLVAMLIAGLSVIGLLLKISPAFQQVNGEIIALLLPANVGLMVAMMRLPKV